MPLLKKAFVDSIFTENSDLDYDVTHPEWRFHNLDSNSEGVTFGIKSHTEIVLSLQGKAAQKSEIFYQLVIGAEDDTVSWISMVKKGKISFQICRLTWPFHYPPHTHTVGQNHRNLIEVDCF